MFSSGMGGFRLRHKKHLLFGFVSSLYLASHRQQRQVSSVKYHTQQTFSLPSPAALRCDVQLSSVQICSVLAWFGSSCIQTLLSAGMECSVTIRSQPHITDPSHHRISCEN